MSFDWKDIIEPLLVQYDVLGATGCHFGGPSNSILVNVEERRLFDDHIELTIQQFSPEGWGLDHYPKDHLNIPSDGIINESMVLLWDVQKTPPDMGTPVWIFGVVESEFTEPHEFRTTNGTFWIHATGAGHSNSTLKFLELCGGGFGGWKSAISFLGQETGRTTNTIAVEQDLQAAAAYAISHRATLIRTTPHRDAFMRPESPGDWVVVASVVDRNWWPAVAKWQPHVATISSPCQPWSNAAQGDGLNRADGQLLLHCICSCRYFRPPIILIEQVLGFAQHRHKPWIIRALHMIGYKLIFDKCLDLHDQSATTRVRWIGIAVRVQANLPHLFLTSWPRFDTITVQQMCPNVQIPENHHEFLQVDEHIKNMAQSPQFFRGNRAGKTPAEVLSSRIHVDQPKVPTFMASYGSQHLFATDYLGKFGYFGHFKADAAYPHGFRFWHPAEVSILHGILGPVFFDEDIHKAWMHVGNQIAIPHALLPLVYAFNLITDLDIALYPIFEQYHAMRKSAKQCQLWPIGKASMLYDHQPSPEFVTTVSTLLDAIKCDFRFSVWSPTAGLLVGDHWYEELIHGLFRDLDFTSQAPISILSADPALSPTVSFVPVVPVALTHQGGTFDFWISADLPWHHVESVWHSSFKIDPETLSPDMKPILRVTEEQSCIEKGAATPIVMSITGSVSILANHNDVELLSHQGLQGQDAWWDQFGPVESGQHVKAHTLIMPEPLKTNQQDYSDVQLSAILQVTTVTPQWIAHQDLFILTIEGDLVAQHMMANFVAQLLHPDALNSLGRKLTMHQTDRKCILVYEPMKGSCPPQQFAMSLAVCATRVCLSNIVHQIPNDHEKIQVAIKWESRPLWTGFLSPLMTIDDLLQLLTTSLAIAIHRDIIRIVCRGHKISNEVCLGELHFSTRHEAILVHVVPALSGGGGPTTKNSQKTLHKNAIAGVLLEQGYDIQWTSKAVEQLTSQFGIPKLQAITAQPMGHQKLAAVQQLCVEAGITMPSLPKPTSGKSQEGAPWQKTKKPKTGELQIQPFEFQILPGFFLNADGTESPVVNQLRGQTTGICLLTPEQAAPWISANQKISPDELGGFIVGKLPSDTTLNHESVVVPCLNRDQQQVLISGVLVQFGGKNITFQKGDDATINAETSHLVAVTLLRADWTLDQWQEAVRSPNHFIQKVLEEDSITGAITAMWGKSLRAGRSPASPAQATSMQVHVTVSEPSLTKLLSRSGFNKVYCTPKTVHGRLDPQFKVIWLTGEVTRAIALAATTCHCLGLVKGRDNFGLRYAEQHFSKAWQVIHPGVTEPTKLAGDKVFKVEGLPFGATTGMLQQWLQHIKWLAEPVKALGPQAWLLRSDHNPPQGLIMFNASPVLVRLLPPRAENNRLVVGPRPKLEDGSNNQGKPNSSAHSSGLSTPDPWAQWQGPRLSPTVSRTIEGPVEKRLSEQDEKIQSLQKDIEKIALGQKQFEDKTTRSFKEAEERDKNNVSQMQAAMKGIQKDLEQSLSKSLQSNAQVMQEQLQELKSLFTSSALKRRAEAPADMEP